MKKNVIVTTLIAIMVLLFVVGCERTQYLPTGPDNPNDPPPADTISTVTGVVITPDSMSKAGNTRSHTMSPGDRGVMFGKAEYISPTNVPTILLDNTGDYADLGVWGTGSTWSQFPARIRAYANIRYGIAYAAKTPAGHVYPLNLTFTATVTYSNGSVVTVPLNKIYQAIGNTINGKILYYGFFTGFMFNDTGAIQAVGDYFQSQLVDMCISFDGVSSKTANGTIFYDIPSDSLSLYQEPLESGLVQIVQCSWNNYERTPTEFNQTLQRHELWIKTVAGSSHCFLIASEMAWIEKRFGVNATIGSNTQELMNIADFDPSASLWKLFYFTTTANNVPQNLFPVDNRRGNIYNVIPG